MRYDKVVDRSDQNDGPWTLHSEAEKKTDWIECVGVLLGGRLPCDLECWYNEVTYAAVEKRNKNHDVVVETKSLMTRT